MCGLNCTRQHNYLLNTPPYVDDRKDVHEDDFNSTVGTRSTGKERYKKFSTPQDACLRHVYMKGSCIQTKGFITTLGIQESPHQFAKVTVIPAKPLPQKTEYYNASLETKYLERQGDKALCEVDTGTYKSLVQFDFILIEELGLSIGERFMWTPAKGRDTLACDCTPLNEIYPELTQKQKESIPERLKRLFGSN